MGRESGVYLQPNTVQPPVSQHLECQVYVVAYRRLSITRAYTILEQEFASLEYGNCLRNVINVLFSRMKSQFREKIRYSSEKFRFLVLYRNAMLQNLIIQVFYSFHPFKWSLMAGKKQKKISTFKL